MTKLKVGINGMGRIGRAVFRHLQGREDVEVACINDINPDPNNIAYLIKYDSTYGRMKEEVAADGDSIHVGSNSYRLFHKNDITDVPWNDVGVDIVVDSSGVKANLTNAMSNPGSVKNYIVTNAPSGFEGLKTVIFGVNEDEFNAQEHRFLSSSICDTIALTPILKTLRKTHEVESGFLTTLHPWLSYQNLLDGPSVSWSIPGDINSHFALGRSSIMNIIPKSTSAVNAADFVFPGLSDRLASFSYRVPTNIVSGATLVLMLDKEITRDDILTRFSEVADTQSHKVVKNSSEPLTSLDYLGEDHSVVIDHRWTKVENGRHLQMVYWYDNEWGYSARVADLVCEAARQHRLA